MSLWLTSGMALAYTSAVVWPRAGLAASVAIGALAMISDQMRMQPGHGIQLQRE